MPSKKQNPKPKRGRPSLGLTSNVNVRLFQGQPERIEKLAKERCTEPSTIHRQALEIGLRELESTF